jgi:hypothetical protein
MLMAFRASLVSTPQMDEVVCAHNFSKWKGAKPIVQATVVSPQHLDGVLGLHVRVIQALWFAGLPLDAGSKEYEEGLAPRWG